MPLKEVISVNSEMDVIENILDLLTFLSSSRTSIFTRKKKSTMVKERMIKFFDRNSLSSIFETYVDEKYTLFFIYNTPY